jgi:hypothetical protein
MIEEFILEIWSDRWPSFGYQRNDLSYGECQMIQESLLERYKIPGTNVECRSSGKLISGNEPLNKRDSGDFNNSSLVIWEWATDSYGDPHEPVEIYRDEMPIADCLKKLASLQNRYRLFLAIECLPRESKVE